MFGDLMGNMQEKQEALKKQLESIPVSHTLEGITIKGTAAKTITDVQVDEAYLAAGKKDELEDLLTLAMNEYVAKVAEEEAKASQQLIKDLLPGMGGMFG